jgi:thiol:disulfide interchange protein
MFRLFSLALLLGFSQLTSLNAQFAFGLGSEKKEPKSVAALVAEDSAIAPGKPFTVALKIDVPAEWHSYYLNSGGPELPLNIQWTLPEGYTAGPIQWPTPEIVEGYEAKSFVYSGSPIFLTEITPPASAKVGEVVELTAQATWQICQPGRCLDEKTTLRLSLPIAETATPDPSKSEIFQTAKVAIPRETSAWKATFQATNDALSLKLIPQDGAAPLDTSTLEFIPSVKFAKNLSDGGKVEQQGDHWVLSLARKTQDIIGNEIPLGDQLDGILTMKSPLDTTTQAQAILIHARADTGATPASDRVGLELLPFLVLLGLMMLGGLLLNLMPCVFPVIGLKIMSFVQQSGEDPRKIVKHGLAFTFGVLISFWILSGILLAVGAGRGWGYQLQDPRVVLALLVLMLLLALNMFGVFEIGTSATSLGGTLQSKKGLAGAFFSGILATVVATPCSAPFLGAAIGKAIGLPPTQFFPAFTAMGLGLAMPYLFLSIFPGMVKYLPRPGAWMESFKQAMSFLLFATAGYLLYVYVGQIALENMPLVVIGLSAIAISAWIYGRWNLPHRTRRTRTIALILTLLFGIGGLWMAKPPVKSALVWQPWSAERVAELTKEGVPVYVDFTANWCVTCQVNKKRAYTPEVIALMQEKGVVTLRADKTNPDPAIEKALRELERTAIPVNVLYVPGEEPVITPEILSADYMKSLIGGVPGK